MPVFAYRAFDAGGRTRAGVVGAESVRAARQALRARGEFPTEVREETGAARGHGRPAAAELAAVLRQLATLVGAGVPLADALGDAAAQAGHPALVGALTAAHARVCEGLPLADALAATPRVFPALYTDLVRAGEASGALAAVLARLADHGEAAAAVRAELRAALTYPVVMIAATAAVLAVMLVWVVPQVTRLFADSGARLPLATRLLVGLTGVVRQEWWVAPLGVLAAALGARRTLATAAGRMRLDAFLLRVPVVGELARRAAQARVARTLATLLTGGVPLEAALAIAAPAAGNRVIGASIERVREAVRQGQALAPAMAATGDFPPLVVRLAAVGERSGGLADALERAADAQERDVAAAIATATALLEPTLILVMGGVVLALASAILLPLFDLNGLVQH
jgi:type II secretory pathway component PulF